MLNERVSVVMIDLNFILEKLINLNVLIIHSIYVHRFKRVFTMHSRKYNLIWVKEVCWSEWHRPLKGSLTTTPDSDLEAKDSEFPALCPINTMQLFNRLQHSPEGVRSLI